MGRTRSQLSAQLELVDRDRLSGFAVPLVLLAALGWIVFQITHLCPEPRTALFSPVDVALELERQDLPAVGVPDSSGATRGGFIIRSRIGGTGIIAVVWPDNEQHYWPEDERGLASEDARWRSRLTRGYERRALNLSLYALRGGSEADRSRVRVAISRASRHLFPGSPPTLDCPADE